MKTLINALSEISYNYIDELKEVGNVVVKKRRLTKRFWLFTSIAAVTVSVGAYIAIASNFSKAPNDIESSIYSSDNVGVAVSESSEPNESSLEVSYESSFDAESSSESGDISDESSQPIIDDDTVYECRLIVNGKDITEGSGVKMYSDRVELPFVAIMEELGVDFFWDSDTIAQVHYNMVSPLKLDIEHGTLTRYFGGDDTNRFTEYCDTPLTYTTLDKDILINAENFKAFVFELNYLYSVEYFDIDYENKVVKIGRDLKDYSCTLILNGNDISKGSRAVMRRDDGSYFLLPIVEIMEALGAEFEWESDTLATFIFKDVEYILDITNREICRKDDGTNLTLGVVGGVAKSRCFEKELLLDHVWARQFFDSIRLKYEYDFDQRTVTLELDESIIIDRNLIYYNPEIIRHLRFYDINGFETGVKGTPSEFLEEVYIGEEAYFCIEFIDYYNQTFTDEELDLLSYLESVGFVIDEELTEKLVNYDKDGEIKKYIGYVKVGNWNKLVADDYKIQYNWLTETCVNGQCAYHNSGG